MDNAEIVATLNRQVQEGRTDEVKLIRKVKFLVFVIGERKLAVQADSIREIVIDLPIFYVPFVPLYVRGFINRHGEPFTVVDLNVLFQQKLLEASTFLVLSDAANPAAFLITDVIEIMKVNEDDVHLITSRDENQRFIMGSITGSNQEEILILDIAEIFKRLERDIES